MTRHVTEIEVEVVEIDGIAPVVPEPRGGKTEPRNDWRDWRQWQGKVRRLDSRWWPLWGFLGIIALGFLLTVSLLVAVVFGILRGGLHLVRAILR